MTTNLSTIALWVGIVGTTSGVYFSIHSELSSDRQAQALAQKAEIERTAQAQKDWGLLLHRLSNDESAIAFLETQMPKDKREMLKAISQAQIQAQVQEQQTPLRVTKGMHNRAEKWERKK
jgi:hypothetical protein